MNQRVADFKDGTEEIKIGDGPTVRFQVFSNNKNLPCDVEISVMGKARVFPKLAWVESVIDEKNKLVYRPKLIYVLGDERKPFFVAIGLYSVISVVGQNVLSTIIDLNRRETDDKGFYFEKVLLRADSFVLTYEGGAAKIEDDGRLLWHVKLSWDDVYERCDGDYLHYKSEFSDLGSKNWALSISTGEKVVLDG